VATPLESLTAAYESLTLKIADVLSNPRPDYTLPGGASVKWSEYYKMLLDAQKAAREGMIAAAGPFDVVTVVR
jgi:hypothetical protein